MAFCVCFYELNGITISPSLEKVVSVETVHQIVLAGWSQLEHVPVVPGISPGLKEWVLGVSFLAFLIQVMLPGVGGVAW